MSNKEKFLELVSDKESNTIEKAKRRKAFKDLYPNCPKLALFILKTMEEKGVSKEKLSNDANIPLQKLELILSGKSLPFVEDIYKIENYLKTDFLEFRDTLFPLKWDHHAGTCLQEFHNMVKADRIIDKALINSVYNTNKNI